KNGRESDSVILYGTTPAYQTINGLEMEYGTFLRQTDVDNHTYVAVINQTMAEDLVGTMDCLGEKISLNGLKFTIIGILAEDEDSLTSSLTADMMVAYIPYTTAQRVGSSVPAAISSFYISTLEGSTAEEMEANITD
ncbi:MAG: ABC transporter permease, partial [Oscillospiraceae bacterium]|nr:ABC transporter permease [Oscillospiraceae bacterium]